MADEPLILAIKTDDSLLHVAPRDVLSGHVSDLPEDPSAELEFFDGDGTRWELADNELTQSATPARDGDRRLLLDRIDLVLARIQVDLDRRPPPATPGGAALTRIPRVHGELPEVLTGLAAFTGDLGSHLDPGPSTGFHAITHWFGIRH